MKKKYSDNFERDNKFYFENIKHFNFCGTLTPKFEAIEDVNGKNAKEVFYLIDSTGKNYPTCEPKLLNELLMCKASVNFHIKQWAEGRADGTLPFSEFAGDGEALEWKIEIVKHKYFGWLPNWTKKIFSIEDKKNVTPIYQKCMAIRYGFPEWVIKAVEMQKIKLLEADKINPDWLKHEVQNQKEKYKDKGFSFSV
jgi:hypothetical protein